MARRRISDYIGGDAGPQRRTPASYDPRMLIKETVEAAVAELAKGLVAEIRRLRESIEDLAARVERLEQEVRACRQQAPARASSKKRQSRLADRLVEILESDRYLLASKAREKLGVSPYKLRDLAGEVGAEIVDLNGDYAVIDPEALREFRMLLASTRQRDPEEAAKSLGVYRELFEKMRAASMVYYDAARGSWRMLD